MREHCKVWVSEHTLLSWNIIPVEFLLGDSCQFSWEFTSRERWARVFIAELVTRLDGGLLGGGRVEREAITSMDGSVTVAWTLRGSRDLNGGWQAEYVRDAMLVLTEGVRRGRLG